MEEITPKDKAATIYEALVRLYGDMEGLRRDGEKEVKLYGRMSDNSKEKYRELKDFYDVLVKDMHPYREYLPNIRFVSSLDDMPDSEVQFVDVDFYLYGQINSRKECKNIQSSGDID